MTALIASHTQNKEVRSLGAKISSSQSDEISFMQRWLAARGEPISMAMPGMPDMDMSGNPIAPMPGMLTPEQMEALAEREGRGVRPPVFDRDDSAPQGCAGHGEGFVRYRGRGAGRGPVQLRHRCGQYATGRDQNYAEHAGGETLNPSEERRFPFGRRGRGCFLFRRGLAAGAGASARRPHRTRLPNPPKRRRRRG